MAESRKRSSSTVFNEVEPEQKRTPPPTLQQNDLMSFQTPIFAPYANIPPMFSTPYDLQNAAVFSYISPPDVPPPPIGIQGPGPQHETPKIAHRDEDSGIESPPSNWSYTSSEGHSQTEEPSTSSDHPSSPPPRDRFTTVAGRLNVMGNGGKYDVTINEIKRRITAPESLNSSTMAALLRKAKTANNGKGLREELSAVGIDLPVGKRKQGITTTLTSLVEAEAEHMANDLHSLTRSHYPFEEITNYIKGMLTQSELAGAIRYLSLLQHLVWNVNTPLLDREPEPFHDTAIQQGMDHYSAVTHGFGVHNQRTWSSTYLQIAQRTLDQIIQETPMPPPQLQFGQNLPQAHFAFAQLPPQQWAEGPPM